MIQRHEPKNEIMQAAWFSHKVTGQEFSRVAGGMAWPAKGGEGFAVVVAEGRYPETRDGQTRPTTLRCLSEQVCPTVPRLFRAVQVYGKHCCASDWYGDNTQAALFQFWCDLAAMEKFPTYPIPAPNVEAEDRFAYYLETIRREITRESLIVGDCHQVKAAIMTLPADAAQQDCGDFPVIAALGFAVSALRVYRQRLPLNTQYTPLDTVAGY